MPVKATHRAGAAPLALMLAVEMPGPVWARVGVAALTWGTAPVNDWDHPNYERRMHFGAMAVRWSARLGYQLRTSKDRYRRDLHRGPSHALEWCALLGALTAVVALAMPPTAPYAMWFGLAVFAGTGSHVLLDWMTPAGVPLCATYNLVVHGEVWRRHALGWWIPLHDVSWWLRWIRLPRPMLVDENHPGCEPGIFHSDGGGEHLIVVPVLYAATGVAALYLMGLLGPLVAFLAPPLTALVAG